MVQTEDAHPAPAPPPVPAPTAAAPRKHATTRSYFLDLQGLLIYPEFRALVCTTCQASFDPKKALRHFSNHPTRNKVTDMQKRLLEDIAVAFPPGVLYPPLLPETPVPPFAHLKPPESHRYQCVGCLKFYKFDSIPTHTCSGNLQPRQMTGPFHTQCFSRDQHFRVTAPSVAQPAINTHKEQFDRQQAEIPPTPITISVPENHRIVQLFLQRERWLEHVADLPAQLLVDVCHLDIKDETLPGLVQHVERHLVDSHQNIVSHAFSRIIGKRPATE